jgi:hypothetical protein
LFIFLKSLPIQNGVELLNLILSAIEYEDYKLDLVQLYKADLFDILQGKRAISVWAPRAAGATEEKRLSLRQIPVRFAAWTFIVESEKSAPVPVEEKPRKFLLSIDQNDSLAWAETVAALKYCEGWQLLGSLASVMALRNTEAAQLLWSDPDQLKQGKIRVDKADAGNVGPTVTITVASGAWTFNVKEMA